MPGGGREVAESCVDSLNLELVATYCKRLHPNKPELAARRIEAIGYQVGLQLAESCDSFERRGGALRWHKVQQNEEPPYVQGAILCQGRNFIEGVRCPPHKLEKYLPVLYVQSNGCQFPSARYTKERPRFADHLEAIKFICKDFWAEVFRKQVDNLKTNHRGVFVLQDNKFRWLTRISVDSAPPGEAAQMDVNAAANASRASQAAGQYLYFPCGLIRGALTNLGVACAVSAEVSTLPACSFVVRVKV